MSESGDLVIGRSGDRKDKLSAETRSRGEGQKPTMEALRHRKRSGGLVIKITRTITATLREIFDESAYDRFLLRTHASRSIASYRAFIRERDTAMVNKPRCC